MNRLGAGADQDLLRALSGLTAVRRAESGTQLGEPDITAVLADGRVVQIEVKSLAKPSSPEIERHLRAWRSEAEGSGRVLVLVADQIPSAARDALAHAGLSYLDRRGRLFLHGPGLIVERDLEADMSPPRAPTPSGVRGLGGTAAALAALVRPDNPPGIRETARFAALSHTAVHRGQRALREAGLLEEDGRPVTPDLFEALVRAWAIPQAVVGGLAEGEEYRVEAACGAHLESPLFETLDDLAAGLAPIDGRSGIDPLGGWALTGTLAAAEYGAPVVVGRGARP